jgi:hypothetical protein
MIGSLFSALVSLIKYVADEESQLPAITYWLMGGLDKASFRTLSLGAPVIIAGILVFFLIRWRMNLDCTGRWKSGWYASTWRGARMKVDILRIRRSRICLFKASFGKERCLRLTVRPMQSIIFISFLGGYFHVDDVYIPVCGVPGGGGAAGADPGRYRFE